MRGINSTMNFMFLEYISTCSVRYNILVYCAERGAAAIHQEGLSRDKMTKKLRENKILNKIENIININNGVYARKLYYFVLIPLSPYGFFIQLLSHFIIFVAHYFPLCASQCLSYASFSCFSVVEIILFMGVFLSHAFCNSPLYHRYLTH